MSKDNIKIRIEILREKLHYHNHKYYVLAQPEISDFEYDQLLNELINLETDYPEFSDPNSCTKSNFISTYPDSFVINCKIASNKYEFTINRKII